MLEWLLGKPAMRKPHSEAGRMVLNMINEIRSKRGHKTDVAVASSLAGNTKFLGTVVGVMDLLSGKTGEYGHVRLNTQDLIVILFGERPDRFDEEVATSVALMTPMSD